MTRLVALLAAVAGCSGPGGLEAVQGVPFALEAGESARADGHEVRFIEVVEDSRCPDGAECVWAGKARVRVAVDDAAVVLSVPHSTADGPEPYAAVLGDLEVEVQALRPAPAVEPSSDPLEVVLVFGPAK